MLSTREKDTVDTIVHLYGMKYDDEKGFWSINCDRVSIADCRDNCQIRNTACNAIDNINIDSVQHYINKKNMEKHGV